MLLKIINDLCEVTNILMQLVRELLDELEKPGSAEKADFLEAEETDEKNKTTIKRFRERADEAERRLNLIEYNSRRI